MKGERVIAGLACSEVLALLSDYVDGELAAEDRGRVEAHVRACDNCERFGGAFAAVVRGLRRGLEADEPPPGLGERLLRGL